MSTLMKKAVLVDESVWLALCLDLNEQGEEAYRFLEAAIPSLDIFVTATCIQDVWCDLRHVLRHIVIEEGGVLDERIEALISSIAWDSVAVVRDTATVVAQGPVDAARAEELREVQADYRDALLVATAEGCKANCVVTFEESLRECLPVRCVTPAEAMRVFGL